MNIQEAISLIESGHAAHHLSMDLWGQHIGLGEVQELAQAIQSGRAPAHLTIDLGYNNIGADDVQVFREAIQSGQTSYGLRILGLDDEFIDLCEQSDTKKDRAFSLSLCHFFKSHEDNPLLEVGLLRVTQDFAPKSKI